MANGVEDLEPVPLDEPSAVVDVAEREQRLLEFLHGVKGVHPEKVLLERADEALGVVMPLDVRTKARELSMPRKASSFRNTSDMYWLARS